MKHTILWLAFALPAPTLAQEVTSLRDFPAAHVEYTCRTALFYMAKGFDACVKEQYGLYDKVQSMGLTDKQYRSALWYGQRTNWKGEVVGVDFLDVLNRVEYLK